MMVVDGSRELFKSREPFDRWMENLSGERSVDDLICLPGALDGQMTWFGRLRENSDRAVVQARGCVYRGCRRVERTCLRRARWMDEFKI
jgi:hypothetical protein